MHGHDCNRQGSCWQSWTLQPPTVMHMRWWILAQMLSSLMTWAYKYSLITFSGWQSKLLKNMRELLTRLLDPFLDFMETLEWVMPLVVVPYLKICLIVVNCENEVRPFTVRTIRNSCYSFWAWEVFWFFGC